MRKAGRLAAEILDAITALVVPGAVTSDIDDFIREMMLAAGAVPATLGYHGYQYSSCISLNNVICHGMPGDRVLREGDILNIDVTAAGRRLAWRHQPHVSGRRRADQGAAAGRRDL